MLSIGIGDKDSDLERGIKVIFKPELLLNKILLSECLDSEWALDWVLGNSDTISLLGLCTCTEWCGYVLSQYSTDIS